MALLIYQLCSFSLLFLCNSLVNSYHLCDPKESFALLEFKKAFSLSKFASFGCRKFGRQDFYPKTTTWKESTDCCSWDGVECDHKGEGHVIGLDIGCSRLSGTLHPNSTLFALSHLQTLNLFGNSFHSSSFSPQFGMFQNLKVLDLSSSSFAGDVPIEISHLSQLVSLDLSSNDLKFSNVVMNQLVHNLTYLRDFALASVDLSGITPTSFMNFSRSLASLRLSLSRLSGNFPAHILSLPNLRVLQLDDNMELNGHLAMSNWSKSLQSLDLHSTNFSGEISNSIGNVEFLRYLDLSFCNFTDGIPKSIGNLTQLNTIHLSKNKFNGQLPNTWSNLQKLTNLEIESNSFTGQLPNSLFNFTHLSDLKASSNYFSGPLPANVSSNRLSNLIDLNLEGNLLNGVIPSWLYALPRLTYLDLSHNHFIGLMKDFKSKSLASLDLSENNLEGEISGSIYRQVNLTHLKLGSNNLSGVLNLDMLLRIQSLSSLDISNNFQLSIRTTNISSMNLVDINMGALKLEKFPYFLRYQNNLDVLDLSNNQIRGEIPKWFSELGSLAYVNLSHNLLSSGIDVLFTLPYLYDIILDFNLFKLPLPMLPPIMNVFTASNNQLSGNLHPSFCQATHLSFLDLSNNNLSGAVPSCITSSVTFILKLERNNFSGAIPIPPPSFSIYTASENQFTGEIPHSICHATFLGVLSLSNNRLSGTIPPCLTNMTYLLVLDLKNNNFYGTIPTIFPSGSQLRSLDLNNNQLEGELPPSLLNCENLQDLNLGNNKITGYFPHWLESASSLQVLILRSNRFYGHINNSMNRHSFPNLRIIDLSRNHFSGSLPSNLFKNLRAMKEVEVGNQKLNSTIESDLLPVYQKSVVVSLKGLELKVERILLIFKVIDLSSNDFSGEIPKSIGMLTSLKGLNISHNKLTGGIPMSFGNLTNLEGLDLSSNKLSGNIPLQLVALTFLSFLNLSQNQLSGQIPQGKQFATFENSSYMGNLGLCGFPLQKCDAEKDHKSQLLHDEEEDDILEKGFWWKVVFMGYGCGMVFGIFVGYIVFWIGKPAWIVALVDGKRTSKRRKSKRRNCWPKQRND